MKKSLLASYVFLVFVAYLSFVFFSKTYDVTEVKLNGLPYSSGNSDDRNGRLEQEQMKLMDPATNKIPNGIFKQEQEFAKTLPKKSIKRKGKYDNSIQSLTWTERGPNNIGGRTRALGIDVRTGTSPNITIIAGGVSGGIWKSTDDGGSWTLKTEPGQLHNATCIVQDTRSGHEDTWYVGTGEGLGNSASLGSAFFRGDGIFKSTDNGETWSLLSSTTTNNPEYDSDFDYVSSLAIDPTTGDVYACASSQIYKSTDGGSNWNKMTANNVSYPSTPGDIQLTSGGIIYTAISTFSDNGSSANSVRRSSDGGTTWTDITAGVTDFPTVFYRGVLGISPSNPNIVYFLFSYVTSSGTTNINGNQIWKYTYNSGDGSGTGGTWENRSVNLPDEVGGSSGNDPFDTQTGYDMLVQVKPDDENFVILGGTNLYYSTDGFATNTNYKRIGGYAGPSTYSKYLNHHPDLHSGAFRPGSNFVYYSGDDGGIQRTDNVTATSVVWTTLNNSFNVTQFYSVSLDPESGSNIILAGAQDNGSLLGTATGASDWTDISSGDGAIVNIPPLSDNKYYPERQSGSLLRVDRNGYNSAIIKPNGSSNPLFANPVVLDKNDSKLMYFAGGNTSDNTNYFTGIWRNSDATTATTVTGWSFLSSTGIASDPGNSYYPRVSAIGLSQSISPNVLYYGTSKGQVKKVTDANATPSVTDVTGSSFPSGAYVSCISVDPTNSNKAVVAFSNYNVQSLWYTSDGGANWTDIEGNLSGSTGPSIRWVSIFNVNQTTHYFLATSIGVYFTTTLNGSSTVWSQETASATTIGNVVCDMLDWRSADNTLAVATHGRGVFTTQISAPLPVEITSFTVASINSANVKLIWKTATEINNYGFEVERSVVDWHAHPTTNNWETIGFVQGSGNSYSPKYYEFVDESPLSDSAEYRLKQIDTDGGFIYYDETVQVAGYSTTDVNDANLLVEYSLSQNYPNPFNPTTTISFALPKAGIVNMKIYNSIGEEVKELINENMSAGSHQVTFDASNLSSGLYFYRIAAGEFVYVKKMLLIK